MQAPALTARSMKKSPAQTRHSLFANATVAPRSTAASAGFSPAAPLTAAMTHTARRAPTRRPRRGQHHSSFAGTESDAGAGERVFQLGKARGIGDRGKSSAEFPGQFRQPLHVGMRGQRLDLVTVARGAQQIHGAVADRT